MKGSARGLILESKASIKKYLEEIPLTPDQRAIVEQDVEKVEKALKPLLREHCEGPLLAHSRPPAQSACALCVRSGHC